MRSEVTVSAPEHGAHTVLTGAESDAFSSLRTAAHVAGGAVRDGQGAAAEGAAQGARALAGRAPAARTRSS